MTTITMKEVAAFLLGEAPLDGAWFGDTRPSEHGQFWWRKHLRDALSAPATAPEKTVKEIMEFVRHYATNTFSSATLEDKIRRSLATPATAQVLTPLQDGEKIYALWHSSDANDLDDFLDGWRHAEAFHGIKGGQAMTAITTKYRNPQMQRAFDGVLAADRAQRVPDADDILRVVCETDPADFNDKRNICISPEDLGDILRDALPSPTPTASKLHVWQAAEIERLKTESEERLKNAVALVAENEQLRKDAERYQWLAEYLVSDDESYDDAIVAATTVKEVDSVIDNAMKGTS